MVVQKNIKVFNRYGMESVLFIVFPLIFLNNDSIEKHFQGYKSI